MFRKYSSTYCCESDVSAGVVEVVRQEAGALPVVRPGLPARQPAQHPLLVAGAGALGQPAQAHPGAAGLTILWHNGGEIFRDFLSKYMI